jgi:hypothetical protein
MLRVKILSIAASFPTLIFTVLLGISLVYWMFVLVGAVDLDGGGGAADGLAGAGKGAVEGAMKGVLEGATKGVLEGGVKGVLEAKAGALDAVDAKAGAGDAFDVPDGGVLATLVSALRLRDAPVTVVLSFFSLFGWTLSGLAMLTLAPLVALPSWALGIPVLLGSIVVSLLLTSLVVRPLAPLFATRHAKRHVHLVGRVAVVSTGQVDETFGQATIEDGGAGLILQVRAAPSLGLKRGDRCLITEEEGGVFRVERMTDLLADPGAPANVEALREAKAEVEAALAAEADAAARVQARR